MKNLELPVFWIYVIFLGLILLFPSACAPLARNPITGRSNNQVTPGIPQYSSGIPGIIRSNLRSQYQVLPPHLLNSSFYQVEIVITDDFRSLKAKELIQFTNNETVDLQEIYLQSFPNAFGQFLKIIRSTIAGVETVPELSWNDTAAKFNLAAPLKPGEKITIQLEYELSVPTDSTFSYGLFVYAENILSLYQFIPLIPVHNQDGWQVHQPDTKGDLTFNDMAFFEVQVDAPQALNLAASGTQVSQYLKDGRRVEVFQAGPVRDFYMAGSPDFEANSRNWNDILITSYASKKLKAASDNILNYAEKALEVYSREFGPYPYDELDLVSAPMKDAYGMEYSGIVTMSDEIYDPLKNPQASTYLEFATVHEIAHQWFFNLIGSNQVMEPWLDEGMAQFACKLYYLGKNDGQTENAVKNTWIQRWQRVQSQPIPIGLPVSSYNEMQYSAIIYGRAPLFIQALQEKFGQKVFSEFLSNYYHNYLWLTVSTRDFRSTAEKTCQCSLEQPFNDWIYSRN